MIRRYCDICGVEIHNAVTKFLFKQGRLNVEIQRSLDGTWNGGDVCRECVIRVVTS